MLPTLTPTPQLARHLTAQGQTISDAERILARHGLAVADEYALSTKVLDLYDAAVIVCDAAYRTGPFA